MKRSDVKVAGEYLATIQKKSIRLRIEATRSDGGWDATNLATKMNVRIKNPTCLKPIPAEVQVGENPDEVTEPDTDLPTESGAAMIESTTSESTLEVETPTPVAVTKKLSAIDAAAQILATATTPMTTKQMIETMAAQGLWTSPGGKTPSATLYSSILREITQKGAAARFVKTAAGQFSVRVAGE